MKYAIKIFLTLAVASCANIPPEQQLNFEGNRALDAGRYQAARERYHRALQESQKSGNEQYTAIAMYGLAKSNGYLCNFREAEEWFAKSISLRESLRDSSIAYLSQNLLEFARWYIAQRKFNEAIAQFARAVPMIENLNAEGRDPIALANVLEDYENALSASGNLEGAAKVKERIMYLRKTYAARRAGFTIKPYPTNCTATN